METERNYGVDLLRIVAMWMIVVLHVLGQGGVLGACEAGSVRYALAWALEIASYGAVNCFALISGYVSVGTRFHLRRVALLWVQALLYSLGGTVLYALLASEPLGGRALLEAATPIVHNRWWYVTAYFGIVFFAPFVARLVETLERRQARLLVLAVFAVFTFGPTLLGRDPFWAREGYSTIWLLALCAVGACLRRFPPSEKLCRLGGLIWLLCTLLVWGSKLVLDGRGMGNFLVSYTSPPILLGSAFLLLAFARLRPGKIARALIASFAPLTLGVYMLHTHPAVWNHLLPDAFVRLARLWPPLLIPAVPLTAAAVYLLCAAVDWLRLQLFRLLRLPRLAARLERAAERLGARLF